MNESSFYIRLKNDLKRLRDADRFRELPSDNGTAGEKFKSNIIDFSSNDYLSFNEKGIIRSFMKELPDELLRGSTGSRLLSGNSNVFEKAENIMAEWTGCEDCLLFSSGYAANTGAMDALFSPRDIIFTDRFAHASLLDGIRLSGAKRIYFRHNDLDDLEYKLKKADENRKRDNRSLFWIVTETVFSMDGDMPDLKGLLYLCEKYNAYLYVDEAHAVGLFGKNGAGLSAEDKLIREERIAVRVYPMGKAPGLSGAFVCGSRLLRNYLINHARSLIFSTAPLPVLPFLLIKSIEYMKTSVRDEDRYLLQRKSNEFRTALNESGFDTLKSASQIVPVLAGNERNVMRLKNHLAESGVIVSAIRPPSVPEDGSRLRLSIRAGHSVYDLDKLVYLLYKIK